jgi:iron complex transport system permease protein
VIEAIEREYKRRGRRALTFIMISVLMVAAGSWFFTGVGTAGITAADVLGAIRNVLFKSRVMENTEQKIVLYLRLPRIVLAIFCGMGLSVSGAALQGVTRNPLVSPFTMGISSAAAFGASLSIVFGAGAFPGSTAGIVLSAFSWALLCTILVYLVSARVGMTAESIILTGIAFNYLFNAADSLVKFFASDYQLAAAVQWIFGSLNGATWPKVSIVILVVIPCLALIYRYAQPLNILSDGDDEVAKSLGISPGHVRRIVGLLSVLATAAIISFTGVIGFVGLAGPHIARLLIGGDHRYLLPFSAMTGALLVLAADTLGRVILSPVNVPVGIIISFLGVPVFVNLILNGRRERA